MSARTTRPLLLCLAVVPALVLAAGCGPVEPRDPDMELDISFLDGAGRRLGCGAAGVDDVRLQFETGGLSGITVPCSSEAGVTIVVSDVRPGTYRVLVQGLSGGASVYSGRFDLTHTREGTHRYALDLLPDTELVLDFTFAGVGNEDGMTCAEAQVDRVEISFGGKKWTAPCSTSGRDGTAILAPPEGRHTLLAEAFDAGGRKLYASEFPAITVNPASSNEFILNLLAVPGQAGTLQLTWDFSGLSCSGAGVSTVDYELVDQAGRIVSTRSLQCAAVATEDDLAPGVYMLSTVRGFVGSRLTYQASRVRVYAPAGYRQSFQVTLPPYP